MQWSALGVNELGHNDYCGRIYNLPKILVYMMNSLNCLYLIAFKIEYISIIYVDNLSKST